MRTDLLIIGGGINGVGIATDAAGRGLSVTLCEQDDLASGTSSKSSKLIHGGLRYLETYDFHLVHQALKEREILLKKAPHIIWPLQFVMPYDKQFRPAWLIRLGLFFYDHLSKRKRLPSSQQLDFTHNPIGTPLKSTFKKGFSYYDCYVDDARLVVLNAIQARELGATVLTRTKLVTATRHNDHWQATLQNTFTNEKREIHAKVLVNAAGPWVDEVVKNNLQVQLKNHLILVKGSHIVVPKLYAGDYAFILQNTDKRIIFIIPFANEYSLIGTTDMSFTGDLQAVSCSAQEIDYLCQAVNHYFNHTVKPSEIVWTYAGVRPLTLKGGKANNLSDISREYDFELEADAQQAPLLNILGGKITTYRKLAEDALKLLNPFFPTMGPKWTATESLPGGNFINADFPQFFQQLQQQYPWLPIALAHRYARNYGTLAENILQKAEQLSDLGRHFGAGLYEREIAYLVNQEWAHTVEDILWRRTKLGLQFPKDELPNLEKILTEITKANNFSGLLRSARNDEK